MFGICRLFCIIVLSSFVLHSGSQDLWFKNVSTKNGYTSGRLVQAFQNYHEFKGVVSIPNSKPLMSQRMRRQIENAEEPPSEWTEHWWEHKINLKRVYLNKNNRVVVYFDNYPSPEPSRFYNFISRVWAYMTKTYGTFGPDPYLYAVLHRTTYGGCHHGYSIDPKNIHDGRNVLDCGPQGGVTWTTSNDREWEGLMDMFTTYLGAFVESSSKDRWGSPSFDVWRLSAWRNAWIEIFTYDVYIGLQMHAQANRYLAEKLIKSDNNPRPNTFWFKDWFLPIYTQFGRTQVLNRYFELLYEYYPTDPKDNKTYAGKLNMGEFVHFWSGAAGHNLTDFANLAFGWNITYMFQMDSAIKAFPEIFQLYNCRGCDQLTTPEALTTAEHESINLTANTKPDQSISFEKEMIFSIAAAVLLAVMALGCAAFIFFYKKRISTLQVEIRSLTKDEVKEFFEGDGIANIDEEQSLVQSMPFVTDFELTRDQIIVAPDKKIGSGQFGCVIHGVVRTTEGELIPVAVKTVERGVEVLYFKSLLSEAKIMAYLGRHENIVRLVGTFTSNIQNREIFIALELCPLGDLYKYLRNHRKNYKNLFDTFQASTSNSNPQNPIVDGADEGNDIRCDALSTLDLLKFSHQISNALVFLTEKKVIHADLAARNVLLTANRVAQISDFGLSRQLINYSNYKKTTQTPLPWRWMAIESLKDMKFSIKSDVWAFGVTLWEIFSLAETPYPGWSWDYDFVDKLVAGARLKMPVYGNSKLFSLMVNCWKLEPLERSSFLEIHDILGEMISDLTRCSKGGERNTLQHYVCVSRGQTQV